MKKLTKLFILLFVLCVTVGVLAACGGTEPKPSEGLVIEYSSSKDGCYVDDIGTCIDTDIVIPKTYKGKPVVEIARHAFYKCENITSIYIPDSVTTIGTGAFEECENLKSVKMSAALTSIGKEAFYRCRSLESIVIPGGVEVIKESTFESCNSLSSVTISEGVKTIEKYAFNYCNLSSISFPKSLTKITGIAFSDCSLKSVVVPIGVTELGSDVFDDSDVKIIYCEAQSQPEGWHSSWNSFLEHVTFWGNDWHYENNEPTLNDNIPMPTV